MRTKMKLTKITSQVCSSDGVVKRSLQFDTQYDQSLPEDTNFQKIVPTGTITVQVNDSSVLAQFVVGNDYYIDFMASITTTLAPVATDPTVK